MPIVSVVISSYNHAPYVKEAIESALSQKDCDLEVIVVDDGSTDDSPKIIESIKDSRLKTIYFTKNQGACHALNRAIEESQGEFIAVLNSDDRFTAGKLRKQLDFLNDHPETAAVFSRVKFIDEKSQLMPSSQIFYDNCFLQPNRKRTEWLRHFLFEGNALCHPSLVIRRSCYQHLGLYDPRLRQLPDFDMWIRLTSHYNIHILEESLLDFRILKNAANVSAPSTEVNRLIQWELFHILPHFLKLSPQDYFNVFPEDMALANKLEQYENPDFIAYCFAQHLLSLKIKRHFHVAYRTFALEILYRLLEFPEKKPWLKQVELTTNKLSELARNKLLFDKRLLFRYISNWNLPLRALNYLRKKISHALSKPAKS